MSKTSPTQRSLALLREEGYTVQVTEHYNGFSKRRVDLFGIIDLIGIKDGEMLAVQTTSAANISTRANKALAEPRLRTLLTIPGFRFVLHGWSLRCPRGERPRWGVSIREIRREGDNLVVTTLQ